MAEDNAANEEPFGAGADRAARELFTVAEWLTVLAAIRFAGEKVDSAPLQAFSGVLQFLLFIYLTNRFADWLLPGIRLVKRKWLRVSIAVTCAALASWGLQWLVQDSVAKLVAAAGGA